MPRRQRAGGRSGRLDETSLPGQGQGRSRERAVETSGPPLAVRLPAPREQAAARRWLQQARRQGLPETRPLAGSAAKEAASQSSNEAPGPPSRLRQGTEGKKRVEQDERAGQRRTCPRLGCKRVDAALGMGAGVARMPMSQTRQRVGEEGEEGLTTAALCSSLAASALRIPRIPATQSMGR